MTKRRPAKNPQECPVCQSRGWLVSFNVDRDVYEIQRCDTCGRHGSDKEAGDVAAPMIEAALAVMQKLILDEVKKVRKEKGSKP